MYKLMKLPFSYNALKPDISALTVDIHYNKHHKIWTTITREGI